MRTMNTISQIMLTIPYCQKNDKKTEDQKILDILCSNSLRKAKAAQNQRKSKLKYFNQRKVAFFSNKSA